MARKAQAEAYKPEMSDAAVKLKTGKTWAQWFVALDKDGAQKMTHRAISQLIFDTHHVGPWWCQMVTVEYERGRGLRAKHQKANGYSVSASRTIAVPLADLYEAATDAKQRRSWFPKGRLKITSQTKDKYFRGQWNGAARLDIGFTAKGRDKSLIAIQVDKLADRASVEAERASFKKALEKLDTLLSK
ncbi:MAG TPA: hypothetical protein VGI20_08000 [Rhizomicrobium sp.]|jgi:hypothetical protein